MAHSFESIVSNAWRAGIASLHLTKMDPNSASAAEDITAFMIFEMARTDPLFGRTAESSDMKKCPPALLLVFYSDR